MFTPLEREEKVDLLMKLLQFNLRYDIKYLRILL